MSRRTPDAAPGAAPTVCAVGGGVIVGRPFLVRMGAKQVPMCRFHGRVFQLGEALIAELGRDHPLVVPIVAALAVGMDSACPTLSPAGGSMTLPEPGTEGGPGPLLRRGPGSPDAGVPDGMAVG